MRTTLTVGAGKAAAKVAIVAAVVEEEGATSEARGRGDKEAAAVGTAELEVPLEAIEGAEGANEGTKAAGRGAA